MPRPEIGMMLRRELPPERVPELARRIEAAGFDEVWLVEDCFFAGGIGLTAVVLAATSAVPVGLGIVPAVTQNAAFMAMEFATLARLYPGRFLPGIGHGDGDSMRQIGAMPASQLGALEEVVVAVGSLLRGDEVDLRGRHVSLDRVRLDFPPAQPPPIFSGVMGAKSLALSGRVADGTILAETASPAYVAWARERIAAGAAEAGRDGPHRVTVYAWCLVDPDPVAARDALRPIVAEGLASGVFAAQLGALGLAEAVAAAAARADADPGGAWLRDEWLDRLAVVGDPAACAAAIGGLAAAGADAVVLVPPPARTEDQIETVRQDLLPLLA